MNKRLDANIIKNILLNSVIYIIHIVTSKELFVGKDITGLLSVF
jgi:hypothetical protein